MTPFIIPAGEFTFQAIRSVNPSGLPVDILRFLTEQVALGNLDKSKVGLSGTRVYTPMPQEPALIRKSTLRKKSAPAIATAALV
jgi:hypothetical protein